MAFLSGIVLSLIFLIAAIVVLAVKIFFPHHRIVALIVYALGWIPFIYSLSLRKRWILHEKMALTSFFAGYWIHLLFGAVMLLFLYFLLVLFPVAKSPFLGLDDETILQRINEDKTLILFLDKELSRDLNAGRNEKIFAVDFKDISGEKKEKLKNFWISYIEKLLELDLLKERYTTFYQLNVATKKNLHHGAFSNGYAAFLSQHYYALLTVKEIEKNKELITFLNESISEYGLEEGSYAA